MKKDKLKETAPPKTWIWQAYFHLSLFFYVALFFSLREIESDMPFLLACASLWCFSGLLFCMGQAESHAQAQWSSRWITQTHVKTLIEPLKQTPLPSDVKCFNECSQRAMPRLNLQEQLLYCRHQCEQCMQVFKTGHGYH